MPLSDVVQVTITTETGAVAQAGFGVPLILGTHTHNSDRIRYYSDLAGMVSDGFTTTEPEYKMAARIFAQNPHPEEIAVGRRVTKPTQRWAITPVVANSTAYKMKVNGTEVTYTSDANATAAEIIGGLKTAIDALSLAVTTSDQTTYLRIVANTAGAWFYVESSDITLLTVTQDHASGTPEADLAAIALVDNDWYAILSPFNSSAEIAAIATWAESNGKLFIAQTQDTTVITATTGHIGKTLYDAEDARTALIYHPATDAFADAAWAGKVLPLDAGSETWKFKTLAGVPTTTLTTTHINNLKATNTNWYYSLGGVGISAEGTVAAGEFIDVIRGRDWMQARMQERIYSRLANATTKIPFTDAGIAVVEAEVRAQLQDGIDVGFLSDNPAPTVTVPKAAEVSAEDKAARTLNDVTFDAVIAGAIHKLNLTGTIRL